MVDSSMVSDVLGIGITGKTLTDLERRILTEAAPYAVVLFGRNIQSAEQLRELVRDIKSCASEPPLMMIDEEGGRVDRLRNLLPGLPSAESFGEGEQSEEVSRWTGELIGRALRYFDIDIDLAPVVDIAGENAPKGLERRIFGRDPETVITLAGAFMRGLHATGVASCLKHFPGIGIGSADPHYGATVIDVSLQELLRRDLLPYKRLGDEAGAVMIGHGTYPQVDEPDLPATLSRRLTTDLLRGAVGFHGVAISDDMEMHAVSDLGSYETISERALLAGNDVILFCSHIERIPDIQQHLSRRAAEDPMFHSRLEQARGRCDRYRAWCTQLRAASKPVEQFDDLVNELVRFLDFYEKTRPARDVVVPEVDRRTNARAPGKGKTGREEWT
ncbi:MAG TPA: beta-N-acetylhexosaminidase [Thermoanaerobaculia bacterium]|nr:beta-N-acetylhexosaminidase [Thermoanaerobaculia bacterium]